MANLRKQVDMQHRMTNRSDAVRLLPWVSPDGKPCFLAGDGRGYLSRVADNVEAIQLGMGADLLGHATDILGDPKTSFGELRFLAARLVESLTDALRVAESRGARLPVLHEDLDSVEAEDLDGADGSGVPPVRPPPPHAAAPPEC
ncbi:hypothetical protein ACQB60_36105 [Actinomycetota bacterium Odt1-20B]